MSLTIGSRTFAPRAWAVALTAALVAGFVTLGGWQVGRAREKGAMIEAFERGSASIAVLSGPAADGLPRYQRVSAEGRYDAARQVLLDNMPSATGQPGYRVLTPLRRTDAGRLLLVDRGWVPLGESRARRPIVPVGEQMRTVTGRLDRPPVPGVRIGPAQAPGEAGWPRVLNFPTQGDLETALGEPVEPRILLLDATEPDGYERVWKPSLGFPPERHLGYAVQWFALALALVVIFVALNLHRAMTDEGRGE